MANSDYVYSFSSSHGRLKLTKKLKPSVKAEREAAAQAEAQRQAEIQANIKKLNTQEVVKSAPLAEYSQKQNNNAQMDMTTEENVNRALANNLQNESQMRGLLGDYQLSEEDNFTAFRKRKNF